MLKRHKDGCWNVRTDTIIHGSSNNAYEGSSGARYQYDMSNPSDRLNYGVDLDAQMRDQLSVDPSRGLDRGLGQFGGGIYD